MRSLGFSIFIIILLIARTAIVNVNSAEWGDSYRILRASNFIRNFSYPKDEKRPPFFSALLAIRPQNVDAVLWGRVFMLVLYFATLYVFYRYTKFFLPHKSQRFFALLFLFLNPIYLYWSLRIYADLLFSFMVLCTFYLFEAYKQKPNSKLLFFMGVLCGLAILTRFEGYLLTASLAFSIIISKKLDSTAITRLISFTIGFVITTVWWLIYQNPFSSSYFQEAKERSYNISSLVIYFLSYLYMLGSTTAFALIINKLKSSADQLTSLIKNYPNIFSFVIFESILILLWPAAVPRLFVGIIPLFVIIYVKSLFYFDKKEGGRKFTFFLSILLCFIYLLVQGSFREQFLGSQKIIFVLVNIVGLFSLVGVYFKLKNLYAASAAFSSFLMAFSVIYIHKDVYASIKEVATFPLRENAKICPKVWHNDLAGIVSWYVPNSSYKNFDDKRHLELNYLKQENVDCLIITNEFNPNMRIDLSKRPYLQLVSKSEVKRSGKIFFTWLVKVNK